MTAATNRRNRRAQARSRRRAGASWSASARQRRADTTTFTYSDPMFLTAVDGPSGRLATYVFDSESKRRRIYEGAAFTTIVWDYLQSYAGSKPLDYHTEEGLILAQRIDEDYAEYLPDFLGTVVAYADESGTALTEARYKPYGLLLWSDGPVEDFAFGWVGQWDNADGAVAGCSRCMGAATSVASVFGLFCAGTAVSGIIKGIGKNFQAMTLW